MDSILTKSFGLNFYMMQNTPQPIVVDPFLADQPHAKADACVIWLHGLGADGHDFEGLLPDLALTANAKIRFIFPTAPLLPVTINLGHTMRAWYDIASMQLREQADWVNIERSSRYILGLIQAQMAEGIADNRILLAGFSQGGVVALHAATLCQSHSLNLAGVMALSTYYPDPQPGAHSSLEGVSVFMAHGLQDTVCEIGFARASKTVLETLGAKVDWREYAMAHQVCQAEIKDISDFIVQQLPDLAEGNFHG